MMVEYGSGIYCIRCVPTGKVYVGQAVNLHKRLNNHQKRLEAGRSRHRYLQHAWDKYGSESFVFEMLEEVEPARLVEREGHFIKLFNASDPSRSFDFCPAAGSVLGVKHPPEYGAAIAARRRGKPLSAETRARIAAAGLGRRHTAESIARMSASRKGDVHSPEHRTRTPPHTRGSLPPRTTGQNWPRRRRGKPKTPEHRAKLAQHLKDLHASPEYQAKLRDCPIRVSQGA